jgi:hypothetical protein
MSGAGLNKSDELIPNGSEKLTNLFQLAKKVTNLFQMGVSNLFRLTQKVSFDELIPIGVDELIPIGVDDLIPMDVSNLFSRPYSVVPISWPKMPRSYKTWVFVVLLLNSPVGVLKTLLSGNKSPRTVAN